MMKVGFSIVIFVCTLFVPAFLVFGQSLTPSIGAKLSVDSVMIGDQFYLEVTVEKDIVQIIEFPLFESGNLSQEIEILEESDVDTVTHDGRRLTLSKKYKLTTFEDGILDIGQYPVLYLDKNITDTILSVDHLILRVGTFEIDTLTQTIYDIKKPLSAPLKPGEISGYIIWALIVLIAIASIIWYIVRRRRNLTLFGKPKYIDPPHVAAIKALDILHNQKLWQNGKHKFYYTRLTDIIREYLEGRYGIHAMELTSEEIIKTMTDVDLPEKSRENLKELLYSADLVKFAKYIPDPDSSENAYTLAYYFVEDTKPTEIEEATKPDDDLSLDA